MSLSDPFDTTARLSQQGLGTFGQAIQQTSGQFAQKKQQQIQRDNALGLLTKMGLYTPEGGLDTEKSASAGVEWNPTTGDIRVAPKRAEKTIFDQIKEAQIASEAGLDIKGGKVQTKGSSGGYGAAQLNYAEKHASELADAVESGDYAALANISKTAMTPVIVELRNRGINTSEAILGMQAQKSAMGSARIQEQKVQNAVSAQTLLDASYDPKTGEYKVPPSQHTELALATARMLSQTGVVPYELMEDLRQKTGREQLAAVAIYFGADPAEVGGSTQDVINMFAKLIEREGLASQKMLENLKSGKTTDFRKTLEQSKARKEGKNITDISGLSSKVDEQKVKAYMKKYPDRSREEIIKAMQRS